MKKKRPHIHIFKVLSSALLGILMLITLNMSVEAKKMNVETEGSITIHKYLNPKSMPVDYGPIQGEENGFQGDGTTGKPLPGNENPNTGNGTMIPLPGAEFTVYGRLTREQVNELVIDGSNSVSGYNPLDPKPLDPSKVTKFLEESKMKPICKGVTDEEGIYECERLKINTVDLADNLYLVVETKTPLSIDNKENPYPVVQEPSMPVIVNVPSETPDVDKKGEEANHYNYNVHLYMKNYSQTEPGIEKEIDKPTHSVGELVKYRISVTPLPFDAAEMKELEVTDTLHESLNFWALGHPTGSTFSKPWDTEPITEKTAIDRANHVVFVNSKSDRIVLKENEDYTVTTPEENKNGTLKWVFTEKGIKQLTNIESGDNSRIEIYFTAITNEHALPHQAIPNDSRLDYVNKWGYGTKPEPPIPGHKEPKPVSPPKPSEVVNTIWGDRYFIKHDKVNPEVTLGGAEFLVRNTPTRPVTALTIDENGEKTFKTFEANQPIYAIISNREPKVGYPYNVDPNIVPSDNAQPWLQDNNRYVIGWTDDWKLAYRNHWTLTSSNKDDIHGRFDVSGLAYTYPVHYRKMYIFAEMAVKEVNSTYVDYVKKYHYVFKEPQPHEYNVPKSEATIEAEIQKILSDHPGESTGSTKGNGAWRLYKQDSEVDTTKCFDRETGLESSDRTNCVDFTNPNNFIEYLDFEHPINNYDLIEVRSPDGYAPIEKNISKYAQEKGGLNSEEYNNQYEPGTEEGFTPPDDNGAGGAGDPFEHPFAFTVPAYKLEGNKKVPVYSGLEKDGHIDYPLGQSWANYDGDLSDPSNNVVPVPNAKMPKIPLTGGIGTLIFLLIGIILIAIAFFIRKANNKENKHTV